MIHWVQLDPGRTIMPIEPCGPHLTSGSSNYDSRYTNRTNFDHRSKFFTTLQLQQKKLKEIKIN